ncbi:hypothetical protein QV65_18355 [Rhodococcus erythropolis]|nr:hypothetical protein QV65_18355 [Rhodococcus erythropolis]
MITQAFTVGFEAEKSQYDKQDRATDDRGIRDVEHGPPTDGDEVHHMSAHDSGSAEEPVDEVAQRAAENEAEAQRPPR